MRPRPLCRTAMGKNRHCYPQPEPCSHRRPLGSCITSLHIGLARPLGQNPDPSWAYPGTHTCSEISFFRGTFRENTGLLPSPRMTTYHWDWAKYPERENISWPQYSVPDTDTKTRSKRLSYHLTLAQISDPKEHSSGSAD